MNVFIGITLSILGGVIGAVFSVYRSEKRLAERNHEKHGSIENVNTIHETTIQRHLHNPGNGRSIELVRQSIQREGIMPEFMLQAR